MPGFAPRRGVWHHQLRCAGGGKVQHRGRSGIAQSVEPVRNGIEARVSAPEGRPSLARGVSPWSNAPAGRPAPTGRQSLSPRWGFDLWGRLFQGLTPLANNCRPVGAMEYVTWDP